MCIWRSITIQLVFGFLAISLFACGQADNREFKKASKKFINCAATSPWPVKMTSLTMNSATFVRTDNTWSLPIYFTKSEHPSWSKSHGKLTKKVNLFNDGLLTVVQYHEIYDEEEIKIKRKVTVIRNSPYELVLIGELGDDWGVIVKSCTN